MSVKERRIWLMNLREFGEAIEDTDLAILPVGVCEAHGPHLPLGTDFLIPEWIALNLAERLNALIAPPINYGVTLGLTGYFGTLRISESTMESLMYDVLVDLMRNGFEKVIVMNGHGGSGQVEAISRAMRRAWLDYGLKSAMINWWSLARDLTEEILGGSGGHAGADETSIILEIDPSLVKGEMEKEEIYRVKEGIYAVPTPGSIISYDNKFSDRIPDRDKASEFTNKLLERIFNEIMAIVEGWERQEIHIS